MHVYLKMLLSIQTRTSPPKIYKILPKVRILLIPDVRNGGLVETAVYMTGYAATEEPSENPERPGGTRALFLAASSGSIFCVNTFEGLEFCNFLTGSFSAVQVTARVPKRAPLTCPHMEKRNSVPELV